MYTAPYWPGMLAREVHSEKCMWIAWKASDGLESEQHVTLWVEMFAETILTRLSADLTYRFCSQYRDLQPKVSLSSSRMFFFFNRSPTCNI